MRGCTEIAAPRWSVACTQAGREAPSGEAIGYPIESNDPGKLRSARGAGQVTSDCVPGKEVYRIPPGFFHDQRLQQHDARLHRSLAASIKKRHGHILKFAFRLCPKQLHNLHQRLFAFWSSMRLKERLQERIPLRSLNSHECVPILHIGGHRNRLFWAVMERNHTVSPATYASGSIIITNNSLSIYANIIPKMQIALIWLLA